MRKPTAEFLSYFESDHWGKLWYCCLAEAVTPEMLRHEMKKNSSPAFWAKLFESLPKGCRSKLLLYRAIKNDLKPKSFLDWYCFPPFISNSHIITNPILIRLYREKFREGFTNAKLSPIVFKKTFRSFFSCKLEPSLDYLKIVPIDFEFSDELRKIFLDSLQEISISDRSLELLFLLVESSIISCKHQQVMFELIFPTIVQVIKENKFIDIEKLTMIVEKNYEFFIKYEKKHGREDKLMVEFRRVYKNRVRQLFRSASELNKRILLHNFCGRSYPVLGDFEFLSKELNEWDRLYLRLLFKNNMSHRQRNAVVKRLLKIGSPKQVNLMINQCRFSHFLSVAEYQMERNIVDISGFDSWSVKDQYRVLNKVLRLDLEFSKYPKIFGEVGTIKNSKQREKYKELFLDKMRKTEFSFGDISAYASSSYYDGEQILIVLLKAKKKRLRNCLDCLLLVDGLRRLGFPSRDALLSLLWRNLIKKALTVGIKKATKIEELFSLDKLLVKYPYNFSELEVLIQEKLLEIGFVEES